MVCSFLDNQPFIRQSLLVNAESANSKLAAIACGSGQARSGGAKQFDLKVLRHRAVTDGFSHLSS